MTRPQPLIDWLRDAAADDPDAFPGRLRDALDGIDELHVSYTITFSGRLQCSATEAWMALTDPHARPGLICSMDEGEIRAGDKIRLGVAASGRHLVGVVVRVSSGRRLAAVVGRSVVELSFEPSVDGCTYRLRHMGSHSERLDGCVDIVERWRRVLADLAGHLESPFVHEAAAR